MRNTRRMALAMFALIGLAISVAAQTQSEPQKERPRTTTNYQDQEKNKKTPKTPVTGDRLEPDDTSRTPADVSQDIQANRQEQMAEAAAINPYYNNFFSTYRIGPEDVISVEVFNQPRYSRANIIVPPSGRVSLSLIQGGVFV